MTGYKVLFMMLSLFVFFSCKVRKVAAVEVETTIDSIPYFPIKSSLGRRAFRIDETDYITFINPAADSIKLFNLTTRICEGIPIGQSIRPSDELRSYTFLKGQNVVILTFNSIVCLDSLGGEFYRYDFENPIYLNGSANVILSENCPNIIFNEEENGIYISIHTLEHSYWSIPYYSLPIECFFSFSKSEFQVLNMSYPEIYSEYNFGNAISYSRVSADGRNYVYSFQSESDLIIFDSKSGKKEMKSARSAFQSKPAMIFDTTLMHDMNQVFSHLIVSPLYGKVQYDPYQKLYYRFFMQDLNVKDPNGLFNTVFDKPTFLQILNQDFKVIREIELERYINPDYSFITPKGLHIKHQPNGLPETKFGHFLVYSIRLIE
jgi:hypothetical protein